MARENLIKSGARQELISQLQAILKQAIATWKDTATELNRVEILEKKGAIAKQIVDQQKTRHDVAKFQVSVAEDKLKESIAGPRTQELQEAQAAVSLARSQREASKATLELAIQGPRKEQVNAARARLEQARGALFLAMANFDNTKVLSPLKGRVTLRNVEK
ncbi:hypothetical protein HYY75_09710, partial [bacterium]|nr:hypothetical protein [bacterium]